MPRYAMHIPQGSERPYCGAFMATPRARPRVQGAAYAPPYCETARGFVLRECAQQGFKRKTFLMHPSVTHYSDADSGG